MENVSCFRNIRDYSSGSKPTGF